MRLLRGAVGHLLRAVGVFAGISVLVFLLFFGTGADPAARLAGRGAAPETVAQVRAEYGFDRPLPVQYATLMWRLLVTHDLESFVNRGQRVAPAVLAAAPLTVALVAGAAVVWVAAGLVIGLVSARAGGGAGRAVVAAGLLGVSVPAFWLAQLVAAAAQGEWHATLFAWVPPLGAPPEGAGGWLRTLALPCATMAVLYAGVYGRVLRTGLVAGLGADYARTARAKGLSEVRVALRHALPNAAAPALALLGLDVGALLGGGTVLIEVAFGLHGVGRLTYDAMAGLDLAMLMGCVLYGAGLVVLANAAAGMLVTIIHPQH